MKRALIVGCGYVGIRLAARLRLMGVRVVGTTRSGQRAVGLRSAGVEPLVGSLTDGEVVRQMESFGPNLVAYFVPPVTKSDDPLTMVLASTARVSESVFLYASSTSVYGDAGGEWVDELTPLAPAGTQGKARVAAERLVLEAASRERTSARICRVTGIYGPGRTLRRLLESGEYVLIKGHDAWVNRVHVDDLVTGLIAACETGSDGDIFNMVDDEPHRASAFANLAAELHGLPKPEWIEAAEALERLGEGRLRRKLDSKRIKNRRLKGVLGVSLEYPTYRTGLPAAVAEETRETPVE